MISDKLMRPQSQEIGRIKIGEHRAGRDSPPKKLDHFRITTMERDGSNGDFLKDAAMHDFVGEEPTELEGVLLYDRAADNFHSEMLEYDGRTKVRSCDGERWHDPRTGEHDACARAAGGSCPCKPYGRLAVQLRHSPHTLGVHVFRTTSWKSVGNIQGALQWIEARFGSCAGAPVRLLLQPQEVRYQDGNGRTHSSTAYIVSLVLAFQLEEAAQQMLASGKAMLETRQVLGNVDASMALPPGSVDEAIEDAMDGEISSEADDEVQERTEVPQSPPPAPRGAPPPPEPTPEEEDDPFVYADSVNGFIRMELDRAIEAALNDPKGLPQKWVDAMSHDMLAGDEEALRKWIEALQERVGAENGDG